MSTEAWAAIKKGLYRKFSTGGDLIILDMGISNGEVLVESLFKAAATKGEDPPTPRALFQTMLKAGLGRVHVSGDLESGNRLSMVVKNCAFCSDENMEHPCNFLRGTILAFAEKVYKRQYKSSTLCIDAEEGHICKFELVGK